MGKAILHPHSTLTNRYLTTIPKSIREALGLRKHDQIDYVIENDGKVLMSRAEKDDPLLDDFLLFLANDIKTHPEHIKPINAALYERAKSLAANIEIDLDEPLSEKDE
jgi:antitoxin PrlF